ncbi:hypothetical protein [Kibdelosporangium phytohabitans]|uniref:Uncharacterized protein n=1 Tax=Kibdelosporangium phytohabitans TaxID=860235 RepID=A0A0N9HYP6_9PSEU|nr:hypothetical protein [Kibdelosporangium phytohabitans]ALG07008.1 hypothetical protein AOZ06_08770 [Kibdelosporangium phytohabitans]MBE1468297.1 hypothetical protein [Kibdelosporangium phytohabitans]
MTAALHRAAGLVMLLVITAAPIGALVAERAWDERLGFAAALAGNAELFVGGAGVFCLLSPALVLMWRRTSTWPVLGWWLAGYGFFALLGACLHTATTSRGSGREWALMAVTVAMVGVVWLLNQVLSWVVTWPVTYGLMTSELDILFTTRGWKARLCVRHDRLAVDSMSSVWRRSRDRVTIPWHTLRSVTVERVLQDTVCQVLVYSGSVQPRVLEYTVRQGPAVRVTGTMRDMLLPVNERDAEKVVTAIETRARDAERYELPSDEGWWVLKDGLRKLWRRDTAHHRSEYRPWGLAVVALVCVSAIVSPFCFGLFWMLGLDMGRVRAPKAVVFGGTILFAAGAFFVLRTLREKYETFWRGQDFIEAYPKPTPAKPTEPDVDPTLP